MVHKIKNKFSNFVQSILKVSFCPKNSKNPIEVRFKKIYIEISNSCNFNCSFCFRSQRIKRFMSADEFRYVAREVKLFTDYIYLHVLGEPLLHPHFREILQIASGENLKVNISTNGSLLAKHADYLLKNPVRQLNVSLHDAEENVPKEKWGEFILSMLEIAKSLSAKSYINFRLWNQTNEASNEFNQFCIKLIQDIFHLPDCFHVISEKERNITLSPKIYLQLAPRFEWTDTIEAEKKTCYGLRDQIAILSDGNVVPCCIDADAHLLLGNIFSDKFSEILLSARSQRIRKGFEQHRAVEDWCRKCGFRV